MKKLISIICLFLFIFSINAQKILPSYVDVPWGEKERLYLMRTFFIEDTQRVIRFAASTSHVPDTKLSALDWKIWYQLSVDGGKTYDIIRPLIQNGAEYNQQHPIDRVYINPPTKQNSFISVAQPILLSNNKILAPFYYWPFDENDKPAHTNETLTFTQSGFLIGTWPEGKNDVIWDVSFSRGLDFDTQSSRGETEPFVAELSTPGHLLMTARGSNRYIPKKSVAPILKGYSWYALSTDYGKTWGPTQQMTFCDGTPFYSPSSMTTVLRNKMNGKLYWFGNISPNNPNGNSPRYPLMVAQIDERKIGLIKETLDVILDRDFSKPKETDKLQYSNFRVENKDDGSGNFTMQLPKLDWDEDARRVIIVDYLRNIIVKPKTSDPCSKIVDIRVYPIPTKGAITVELPIIEKNWAYILVSTTGKVIQTGTLSTEMNTLNLENLANGIYFLQLSSKKETKEIVILKQ